MKIEINGQTFKTLKEAAKENEISLGTLQQAVSKGSNKIKRRSDGKIFNLVFEKKRQIIIKPEDGEAKIFPTGQKAADTFGLDLAHLFRVLNKGEKNITRKSDGAIFQIGTTPSAKTMDILLQINQPKWELFLKSEEDITQEELEEFDKSLMRNILLGN